MAKAAIIFALVAVTTTRVGGEANSNYKNRNGVLSYGEILKPPPPPPPLGNIQPVPFHGGTIRTQRQNTDVGYQYPPPPPPPPLPPSANFKFPAPFYRQYNFNFVPPPQPFLTSPSPSIFQKVSSWLFPPPQTSQVAESPPLINAAPIKKDCNPCNLVPWIPVIRYDLSGKKLQQASLPTYGPPSATATTNNVQSVYPYPSQSFQPVNLYQEYSNSKGIPHANYGPPFSYSATPSSTYGPPSPTHTIAAVSSNEPHTSTHGSSGYTYNSIPSSTYGISSLSYGIPSSTYGPPSSTHDTFIPSQEITGSDTNFRSVTPSYVTSIYEQQQDVGKVESIETNRPSNELKLPKVSYPTGFKNSYGEPITSNHALDIPYPVSATAAESSKVKTEILPHTYKQSETNETFSVAKPAPFSINKGRNIHTLQPVALPNLSVSPLPPIFNARPFRTNTNIYLNNLQGINNIQENAKNVDISKSVPVAEYTHSIDYPATVIQSPVIDISLFKNLNQSKGYRHIPNSYSEDYSHDVSSQASEDHIAATKSNHNVKESSFESTGLELDNDLYDNRMPLDFRQNTGNNNIPSNHKPHFTDLRGVSDEEIDKYRTDNNLQSIDSPLLYLKPSAPHKGFDNFVTPLSTSSSSNNNDYEIYDEIPTTTVPELSTVDGLWHKGKLSDFIDDLSPPPIAQEDRNKPKVVQIVIPYTTSNNDVSNNGEVASQEWISASVDESQGRKVPFQTSGYPNPSTVTESQYSTQTTYTDIPEETQVVTEEIEPYKYNTHAILNDLYDVKEPPFDIVKLQQNIDDWTEQEYSKHYTTPHKVSSSGKYAHAKQIPDEYFTTPIPNNYINTAGNYNYNYNFYDYEGSSSIQHAVRDDTLNVSRSVIPRNHNKIERHKDKSGEVKKLNIDEFLRPHIYTASSSFRSTTTTPAPWGKIQTSISPLTKEKVYVVTSKPWHDNPNVTTWYSGIPFESKRTSGLDNVVSASDNLPFKSPRFLNRPPIAPSATGAIESMKADASFSYSKFWHQSINELETVVGAASNTTSASDRSDVQTDLHSDSHEDTPETTTAENYEFKETDSTS